MSENTSSQKAYTVHIVGCGIGGLTTAIALKQIGCDVKVFEAAPVLKPVGAGILMAPNAMKVFGRLGFAETVKERGHVLTRGLRVTNAQRRTIQQMGGPEERAIAGETSVAIHRGILQQVLLEVLGEEHVLTGKPCKHVEQDGERVTLHCEDGSTYTSDLLLGADGIHSAVRRSLFSEVPLRYGGETCWRGVAEFAAGEEWGGEGVEMWGGGVRLGLFPINDTQCYWFSTETAASGGADVDAASAKRMLVERFKDFGGPAAAILEATPEESIIRRDLFDFVPIDKWYKGHIALVGDAAHATTPNMGQGGCQAVEDAWALQLCVQREATLSQALEAYEQMRRPKAMMVVNNSYSFGKVAQLRNPLLCWLRNIFLRMTPKSVYLKQIKTLYSLPS